MLLKGSVKTVTFHNPDNGYSVLKISSKESSTPIAVVGIFPTLKEGEFLDIEGDWTSHPKFGKQFKSTGYKIVTPQTSEHIENYLSSGVLKGVGPAQAKLLVDAFGEDTFHILDTDPQRLFEIEKLNQKKIENILARWQENQANRSVMFFLQSHQIGLGISARIIKEYGSTAVERLKANPYILAQDIWGVGFVKADQIALKMGFDIESYERIKAGLTYTISKSSTEGHVYLTKKELILTAQGYLKVSVELLIYTLDNLVDNTDIYKDENEYYYRPYLYHSEIGIARLMVQLNTQASKIPDSIVHAGILEAQEDFSRQLGTPFQYLETQKEAIRAAIASGIFILTGGPGTGKTTTLMGILNIFRRNQYSVKMAAPTGRAAKRMQDVCKSSASTLHRLLQYDPETRGFKHQETNPLNCDVLIVDEVSMIDTTLMFSLLKAIKIGTRLLFVGDPDQLPSVGPGKILAELIQSNCLAHTHLTTIVRQKNTSPIVTNAHRIVKGELPELPIDNEYFSFFESRTPEQGIKQAIELATQTLKTKYGYRLLEDIQVLTPMNRGILGTQNINEMIQQSVHFQKEGIKHRERVFKVGDKVMQLKNNYDKNVYNGDVGFITALNKKEKTMTVQFDDQVLFPWEEWDQITLAYAITIHKSQGSEFKAVILFLDNQHHIMLQRNLLYTAITRAKERLFIIGSKRAVEKATLNNNITQRHTLLASRLKEKLEHDPDFMLGLNDISSLDD